MMRRLAIVMLAAAGIGALSAGSAAAGFDDSYLVGTGRTYVNAYTAWVVGCRCCRCHRVLRKTRARHQRRPMHK
jgi:hypothetical protein